MDIGKGAGGIGPAGKSAGNIGPVQPGGVGRWWTKERLQFGADYLKKNLGLNDMQARAALARFAAVESPNRGADEGGGGYMGRAQGIGQWLGARRHGYKVGDFESQLAKVAREMQGRESGAGVLEQRAYARLKAATNPQEAAEAMEDFERATSPTVSRSSLIRKNVAGHMGIDKILGENIAKAMQKGIESDPIKRGAAQFSRPRLGGDKIQNLIEDNTNKLNGGAAENAGPGPLSSSTTSNDNSVQVSQNNNYNTTIHAADASGANSMFRRSMEVNAGMALGQAKTALR